MPYFSDRELGPRPRTSEEISPPVWEAIWSVVKARIADGSFGQEFPEDCPDGGVIGTDEPGLRGTLLGHIPDAASFFQYGLTGPVDVPPTLVVLDIIEFCLARIALPHQHRYHEGGRHHHLTFDRDAGRARFREEINTILGRNGIAFELSDSGDVRRLGPLGLREPLQTAVFSTGDQSLDTLLEEARRRFLDPNVVERKVGLDKLWDAYERIKTLEDSNKAVGTQKILDKASDPAASPKLRAALEEDAKALTKLGNELLIRHHEVTREPVREPEQLDYLFGRLFSLVHLMLKLSGRGG